MSKGLGKMQTDILRTISEHGSWMWAIDLIKVLRGEDSQPIPCSFYSSALRAATELVKKDMLRSGVPEIHFQAHVRWKRAFWLPDQTAPVRRRRYPLKNVEAVIIRELTIAKDPVSSSDLLSAVAKEVKADRFEVNRLRVPLHRALKRMTSSGQVQTVMRKCCIEMEKCYISTLTVTNSTPKE